MIAKRRLLADALYRLGVFDAWPKGAASRLVVFNYHRIHAGAVLPTPFDDGVFGPTAATFEAQVSWLARNCNVLSEQDMLDALARHRWPRGRNVVITFDDAYHEQFTVAWPILRQRSLPAIIFVPTQSVSERRVGWWDQIAWLLKETARDRFVLDGTEYEVRAGREAVAAKLMARMKLEKASATSGLVERLSAACGVPLPSQEQQDEQLMTWADLREIARQGGTIGAHTHSHRVLATLSADEQENELRTCRDILISAIGQPVRSLAYPVGNYTHFGRQTKVIARRLGYELGFSFCTGANPARVMDPFDVRRSAAGLRDPTLGVFAAAASVPLVFS